MTGPRPVQAASDRQLRQTIRDELSNVLGETGVPITLASLLEAIDRLDAADGEETE